MAAPAAAPVLADLRCAANPGGACVERHRAERGGTLRVIGRNLSAARQLIFYGQKGKRDDAWAALTPAGANRGTATVPPNAATGPVALVDPAGHRSPRWLGLVIEDRDFGFGSYSALGVVSPIQVALSEPRTIFYGGMQKAVFNYRVAGGGPVDLRVDLVRLSDRATVRSWNQPATVPGAIRRLPWNGAAGGRAMSDGQYAFRVTAPSVAAASAAPPAPNDAITLHSHMFPIQGPHEFGLGTGRFGAGRNGHTHQGQDTFARCGTPLVAARAGKVVYAGYHSAAGYYVVIDGKGTPMDYAYMHLRQKALVATGDTVSTGQPLGEVGDTGDAQGCHLHFEQWTGPGWYKGGHPIDPLPDLTRWDAGS